MSQPSTSNLNGHSPPEQSPAKTRKRGTGARLGRGTAKVGEAADRGYKMNFRPSLFKGIERVAAEDVATAADVIARACEKEVKRVPVLGAIPCGPLAESGEAGEQWMNVGDLFSVREQDYLLRCFGDSMTGDGISDGDLVLIRQQDSCDHNNQIAAVMIETAAGWQGTLKRVQAEPGSPIVTLMPTNPASTPIRIDTTTTNFRVCGVFKGLVRQR